SDPVGRHDPRLVAPARWWEQRSGDLARRSRGGGLVDQAERAREDLDDGAWRDLSLPQAAHGHRAHALREAVASGGYDQRDVRVRRDVWVSEQAHEQDLPGRRREEIAAADDVGDLHFGVVDGDD